MPEAFNPALRRAAADLATMAPADRDWLLERLSAAERSKLHAVLEPAHFANAINDLARQDAASEHAASSEGAATTASSAARERIVAALSSSTSDEWLRGRVLSALPDRDSGLELHDRGLHRSGKHPGAMVMPDMMKQALLDAVDEFGATLPESAPPPDRRESLLRRLMRKVNG